MNSQCDDFRARWDQRLDGVLDAGAVAEFDAHGRECADCGAEFESYSRTVSLVRSLPRIAAPEGFAASVLSRLGEVGGAAPRRRAAIPFPHGLLIAAGLLLAVSVGYVAVRAFTDLEVFVAPASQPGSAAGEPTARFDERSAVPTAAKARGGDGDEWTLGMEAAKAPDRGDDRSRVEKKANLESLGYLAGGGQKAEKAREVAPGDKESERGFEAWEVGQADAATGAPAAAAAEAASEGDAAPSLAYLGHDAAGRDAVLLPMPERIDHVLYLSVPSGAVTDLVSQAATSLVVNFAVPAPQAEDNVARSVDFFLGSADRPALRLGAWTGPVPDGWRALPIEVSMGETRATTEVAAQFRERAVRKTEPVASFAYDLYLVEAEPALIAERLGRILALAGPVDQMERLEALAKAVTQKSPLKDERVAEESGAAAKDSDRRSASSPGLESPAGAHPPAPGSPAPGGASGRGAVVRAPGSGGGPAARREIESEVDGETRATKGGGAVEPPSKDSSGVRALDGKSPGPGFKAPAEDPSRPANQRVRIVVVVPKKKE